jgi:PhnB protein
VILARSRALGAKDAAAVADCGTADMVCYSLAPPLIDSGGAEDLEGWFATWDGPLGYEMRDATVVSGGGVAFVHGLAHMTGRKVEGVAVDLWFRLTLGLKKTAAGWKIVHEHQSVPFYMDGSFRAAVDLAP